MAEKRDYYDVLGISRSANETAVKKAYRKLAMKYHPDVNDSEDAEDKLKEINEAYSVLSDPAKRQSYDRFGFAGVDSSYSQSFGNDFGFSQTGFSDIDDLFGSFFSGSSQFSGSYQNDTRPRQGADRFMKTRIDFMDAIKGKTETISIDVDEDCAKCGGSGARSKDDIETCSKCHGSGTVYQTRQSLFGTVRQAETCDRCHGTGKIIKEKCDACHGRGYQHKRVNLDVKIPAGIKTGQQIRIPKKGELGINGGPNGDLYMEIIVNPHPVFKREGSDIYVTVPVDVADAVIGAQIEVPTVYGKVKLTIPEGTQPNQKFRLRGKGVKTKGHTGDEYVTVKVEIPKKVSKRERELYEEIKHPEKKGPLKTKKEPSGKKRSG